MMQGRKRRFSPAILFVISILSGERNLQLCVAFVTRLATKAPSVCTSTRNYIGISGLSRHRHIPKTFGCHDSTQRAVILGEKEVEYSHERQQRGKKKLVISSLLSLVTSFYSPFILRASADSPHSGPPATTSVEFDTTSTHTHSTHSTLSEKKKNPKNVAITLASGAILVYANNIIKKRSKDSSDTIEAKKRQFERIVGDEQDAIDIIQKAENDDVDEELLENDRIQVQMKGSSDNCKNDDDNEELNNDDALAEKQKEVEKRKAEIKAAVVAKTIAEATERAKKQSQVKKFEMLQKDEETNRALEQEKIVEGKVGSSIDDNSKQEGNILRKSDSKTNEESVHKPIVDEKIIATNSILNENTKTSVPAKPPDLEEQAFNMLVDLGMVEISRDPDSDDYDHSDDNEIVTS